MCAAVDWPGDEGDTSQRQSVASGAKYVEKLNEEFSKRAPMFQDDALFIRCGRLHLASGRRLQRQLQRFGQLTLERLTV